MARKTSPDPAAYLLGKKRWAGVSRKKRSAHARMMALKSWAARRKRAKKNPP